jgi:hypothetical protein
MRIECAALLATTLAAAGCEPFDQPTYETDQNSSSARCCGALGLCVFEGLVSEQVAAHLDQNSCQEPLLCVPTAWILDPTQPPSSCRTAQGLEGRCLPSCLPALATRAAALQQGSCQDGELCAPCYDPASGEDTRACHIDPDPGPSEPPPVPR